MEIRIYDTDKNKHTSKISKWNFLPIIALFSCWKWNREVHFTLMRPCTNVVFMILGGCFISEIVLNLSFRRVKKILVKSDSMFTLACEQVLHVRVSQSKRWTINFHQWENIVRPIKGRERWFFTEWNFIVLDADWLLLIRNDYYAHPSRWINLCTHIIKLHSLSLNRFSSFIPYIFRFWLNLIHLSF